MDRATWKQLLAAAKDAERLIACIFELNFINGQYFQEIWSRLARSIELTQKSPQSARRNGRTR